MWRVGVEVCVVLFVVHVRQAGSLVWDAYCSGTPSSCTSVPSGAWHAGCIELVARPAENLLGWAGQPTSCREGAEQLFRWASSYFRAPGQGPLSTKRRNSPTAQKRTHMKVTVQHVTTVLYELIDPSSIKIKNEMGDRSWLTHNAYARLADALFHANDHARIEIAAESNRPCHSYCVVSRRRTVQ